MSADHLLTPPLVMSVMWDVTKVMLKAVSVSANKSLICQSRFVRSGVIVTLSLVVIIVLVVEDIIDLWHFYCFSFFLVSLTDKSKICWAFNITFSTLWHLLRSNKSLICQSRHNLLLNRRIVLMLAKEGSVSNVRCYKGSVNKNIKECYPIVITSRTLQKVWSVKCERFIDV